MKHLFCLLASHVTMRLKMRSTFLIRI
ncbi:hypothetical protein OF001_U20006 [Pseudomonas sp. OF001]|nr:hypothetical protein OF001_U20006 [Pseudomonas sp. OF001]